MKILDIGFIEVDEYKVGELTVGCTGLLYSEEFCCECDKIREFINCTACIGCGSFNPFGDYYDDSISEQEWEEYFIKHGKRI